MHRRRRRGSAAEIGELTSLLLLALIAIWGIWFGVQSLLTLWWPLNVLYCLAGVAVALVSAAVGKALLTR